MWRGVALSAVVVSSLQIQAAEPRGCLASAPVGTFRLTVQPATGQRAKPLRQVNAIQPGQKLVYGPIQIPSKLKNARVALVLVPDRSSTAQTLAVLEPRPAQERAEWTAPFRVGVLGVVFGPGGLDRKKLSRLVTKDQELISQLADYAEHTAQVETLIDTLTAAGGAPSAGNNLEAALSGFASRYGADMTKLDRSAPSDRQAALLLRTLNPALRGYDPLASEAPARMQQSAVLAVSVAGLFFGSPVGLAAGSAALLQNLHSMLFPQTDFRSALAQPAGPDGMTLCAKRQPAKSRTRVAFLWAFRVPNAPLPRLALEAPTHLPIGVKSPVRVRLSNAADWKSLEGAREWRLVSAQAQRRFPVGVTPLPSTQALEIDLSRTAAVPGTYRLAANWDWETFEASGDLHLHAASDLAAARVAAESQDRLIEGTGPVPVRLFGADFEFVEKVTLKSSGRNLDFTLPLGPRAGPQQTLTFLLDSNGLKAGRYQVVLSQTGGATGEIALRVLPPNPKFENLPWRANLGEAWQKITLRGTGLERIEGISSEAAEIELSPGGAGSREGRLRLRDGLRPGQRISVAVKIEGIETPLQFPGAIEVAGPRPRIAALKSSWPEDLGVALREGELPAGAFVSFSIEVENLEARPSVRLECAEAEKTFRLYAGETRAAVKLEMAGPEALFLSFIPGGIGQAGCTLRVSVETERAGVSDPATLGRVVRLPRIDSFMLTAEKLGETAYAGMLTGQDLETIEKAGWDPHAGLPVEGLPKPLPGEGHKQSLKVALSWPSPAPRTPLYIWLRGEREGRATGARY